MNNMNYNNFCTPYLPDDLPLNNRAKLDTGKGCNYDCYFCYYQGSLDEFDTYEEIIQRAETLKNLGIDEIDLSGGESSIHKKWFDILEYCNKNFKHVSCLSNGYKFSDYEFLKKSKESGLKEILFSLHGYDEESHDKIVGRKGAFNRLLKAIDNSKKLGMIIRINCTVNKENVDHLDRYTELILDIKPSQLNYLPLNYWDSAGSLKTENYDKLSGAIKKSISVLKNTDIEINVRYIPFCFMKGYEKYVAGTHQHIYDLRDWNICGYVYQKSTPENLKKRAKEKRIYTYFKPRECFNCKYFNICDGIEHQYKDTGSLKPEEGEKITDVMEYRRNRY